MRGDVYVTRSMDCKWMRSCVRPSTASSSVLPLLERVRVSECVTPAAGALECALQRPLAVVFISRQVLALEHKRVEAVAAVQQGEAEAANVGWATLLEDLVEPLDQLLVVECAL